MGPSCTGTTRRACWRHCATIVDVKAALADGAVLAVVPLIFDSGKPAQGQCLARCRHAGGDRRGGRLRMG